MSSDSRTLLGLSGDAEYLAKMAYSIRIGAVLSRHDELDRVVAALSAAEALVYALSVIIRELAARLAERTITCIFTAGAGIAQADEVTDDR